MDEDISFSRDTSLDESGASSSKSGNRGSFVCNPLVGDWVEVLYDGVTYTGIVVERDEQDWKIRCLNYRKDCYYTLFFIRMVILLSEAQYS